MRQQLVALTGSIFILASLGIPVSAQQESFSEKVQPGQQMQQTGRPAINHRPALSRRR